MLGAIDPARSTSMYPKFVQGPGSIDRTSIHRKRCMNDGFRRRQNSVEHASRPVSAIILLLLCTCVSRQTDNSGTVVQQLINKSEIKTASSHCLHGSSRFKLILLHCNIYLVWYELCVGPFTRFGWRILVIFVN